MGFIGIDCIESVDSLHHTVFQSLGAGHLFVGVIFAALCSFQCTSLAPSVMFISKYFILFYSIANGIVFFISLSGCFLSVQKYNWFGGVDLISCNFAESIFSNRFFGYSLFGFLYGIRSCHLQSEIVLFLPLQFGYFFLFFSLALMAMARTSGIVLTSKWQKWAFLSCSWSER